MTRRSFLTAAILSAAPQAKWRAGVAAVPITPSRSLWMAGYAARKRPSEGTEQELYAKALALDDGSGKTAVLVSSDILGFPASLSAAIARRVRVPRERLLLNSSHTHCGPVVGDTLRVAYDLTPEQWAGIAAYTRQLEDKVVQVIQAALKDLKPARLGFGRTETGFAANRRLKLNPHGPVDHGVPILRVDDDRGRLRAVVFGYACHNTTLGPDFCRYHGDYAGVAMEQLEKQHPGAKALFVTGCGADSNPSPRGTLELVRTHGESLARAVDKALAGSLDPVGGPLRCAWGVAPLAFAPAPSREEWQAKLADSNVYVQKHARLMLDELERKGRLPAEYPYPCQVWRFGGDLVLVPMAGEVVVDYALRLKRELAPQRSWIAGYSNDVFAYIPSLRVLKEGGYEGGGAMIYYVQPGPFAPSVEETIVARIHELIRGVS